MGYRIQYKPVRVPRIRNHFHSGILALAGVFFALFVLFTYLFWPAGTLILKKFLHNGFDVAYRLFMTFHEIIRNIKDFASLS